VVNLIPENLRKFFDSNVYKNTQYFRITGSHKVNSSRYKTITTKHSFEDTLITHGVSRCMKVNTDYITKTLPKYNIDDIKSIRINSLEEYNNYVNKITIKATEIVMILTHKM
jgi:hypothetical protein